MLLDGHDYEEEEDEDEAFCGATLFGISLPTMHVTPSWEYRNRPWYEKQNHPLTSTRTF